MKRRFSIKRCVASVLCGVVLFGLSGCAAEQAANSTTSPEEDTSTPLLIETIPATPTASPTPVPEMIIDEDGDITLRSDIAAQFRATTFPLDHKPVVGIYNEINQVSYSSGYDMAGYGVVIPGASVKNSDANNILDYGPMKGYNTTFQIPNGSVEQYQALWNAVSKTGDASHIEITIYDKGYTQIKAGLLQIKQVAVALLVSGLLVTVLILLFFCNLFIGKQKRRTAIERSLGMGKRACTISLLTGVMAIVTLGSVIGSLAGYALSGAVIGLLSALSKSVSFSTEFSNWAQAASDVAQTQLVTGMVSPLVPLICGACVLLLALTISLAQIRGNLRSEPLKLLSTPKS